MTPKELDKALTDALIDKMQTIGFDKKRIGFFSRDNNGCEQRFSYGFVRDRGLPGNTYSLNNSLSFSYKEVDRLCCSFLGIEYDAREKLFGTGTNPLGALIPDEDIHKYRYCLDEVVDEYATRLFDDFSKYGLPFYEQYDSLEKIGAYFVKYRKHNPNGFSVIRNYKGVGYSCCAAAVFCELRNWNLLQDFLEQDDKLGDENRAKIAEYMREHRIVKQL